MVDLKPSASRSAVEALFADPAGSLKQQARRERSSANALVQSLAQVFMSVKVDDPHVEIWSERRRRSGGLLSSNSGTFSDLNKREEGRGKRESSTKGGKSSGIHSAIGDSHAQPAQRAQSRIPCH